MEKQVFRGSKVGIGLSLLFTLLPLCGAILAFVQWMDKGIKVNGVLRQDFGALAMILALCSFFIVMGLALLCATFNVRVELDSQGITLFGFWGRPAFNAKWHEVNGYYRKSRKMGIRPAGLPRATWIIGSKGQEGPVPNVEHMALLHSAIVRKLPDGALKSEKPPTIAAAAGSDRFDASMKSGKTAYVMAFSILWYGFLAFFLCVVFFLGAKRPDGFTAVFAVSLLALLAAIPFGTFKGAWLKFLRGRIDANLDGITIQIGRSEERIRWADVRLVEHTVIKNSEGPAMHKLSIVTNATGIEIDNNVNDFEGLLSFVYRNMPPTGCVFPSPTR